MSDEHGWPDFADDPGHDPGHDDVGHDDLGHDDLGHDLGGHDVDAHGYEPLPGHDPLAPEAGGHDPYELPAPDQPAWELHHDDPVAAEDHPVVDVTDGHGLGPVGADPDAAPDHGGDPAEVFPPALDVGPLPEPVDGFPWIDTGSLNLGELNPVDLDLSSPGAAPAGTVVTPGDLAAYAGQELTPGADPWAELAGSDDPATSALARWWNDINT
ncbi:hypothetical protein [Actinoplanes sp. TFC3]|uniref:hypothetical protein n=1 Tax=Actinoplanes sp. TFC3 TaxID=1710355 RepID=UPI00083598B9|nr:hypothetical protein [Actinoplanes sp. TFC3]